MGKIRPGDSKTGATRLRCLAYAVLGMTVVAVFILSEIRGLHAVYLKLNGRASHCSWLRTLLYEQDRERESDIAGAMNNRVYLAGQDAVRNIGLFDTGGRAFWIKRQGQQADGKALLSYLLTEHLWMKQINPENSVLKGDIVLDCGAHVGTFVDQALDQGAEKVVAIEPEPVNALCLRRNFASEIERGRVVVVEKGVWSSPGSIELHVSDQNSGMNSVIDATGSSVVRMPVTTIDLLVRELGLARVDYIKMDIEGSEREALRGGTETLRRWHPRLMLEMYHRPDDLIVLPGILYSAFPGYRSDCGPCELNSENQLRPHVMYYR